MAFQTSLSWILITSRISSAPRAIGTVDVCLLSPNKGIENVILALPEILESHPDVVYIVSGATHPHILKQVGEQYRDSLKALAESIGVSSQVKFNNRFVSAKELVEQVGAADIYITPYRQEAQVVSGTLAIALGAGKAIISTLTGMRKSYLRRGEESSFHSMNRLPSRMPP